jgi:hypothetical protein
MPATKPHHDHLHPEYLPFSADQLRVHFAPVRATRGAVTDRHLRYYEASLKAAADLQAGEARGGRPTPQEVARGRQLEKDERFWVVTALLSLYYSASPRDRAIAFSQLLARAQLDPPPGFSRWEGALAGDLRLYFEANLSSPKDYQTVLKQELSTRMPIPHVRKRAMASSRLEGSTKVDALLLSEQTGAAVLFEAKVLSDVSTHITFDVTRNQIARNIDAMLENSTSLAAPLNKRDPALSSFVLLTPRLMKGRTADDPLRRSRLYGWLLPEYQSPTSRLLGQHLAHRSEQEVAAVRSRLGWATWEDCDEVVRGACPWLSTGP